MLRLNGFGRKPYFPNSRSRHGRQMYFDESMSSYWRLINYNPSNGVIDQEGEDSEPDEEEVARVLKVRSVDLDIKNNTLSHHTNEFDISDGEVYDNREFLVVRRGQLFNMTINFNRSYNAEEDDLRFVFDFGKKSSPSKGTHVSFILSDNDIPNKWGAFIKSKEGNSLKVSVMTPPSCAVGKWSLKVDVVKRHDKKANVYRYNHSDPIYILFNPWCKDDQVYMEQEKNLAEYVLNESGKIFRGNYKRNSPCPWEFGQFSGDVLDCVMYLLDKKSKLPDHVRGDPVKVARQISSLVNGCDNGGVLEGNWSGDYEGGTSPLAWTGSVDILDKYYRTKQTVKYGQCWVFSGVVTTVCRALGIPARSVTNFESAHDTDGSITIDTHFGVDGDELDYLNDDSVWNFHVWNDVWMGRPDLPGDYGGWQAIDATPQEASGGLYCMGPMSLNAIKNGEVNLPYDGSFAFAEVNADRIYWTHNLDGETKITRILKNSVGKYISTKLPIGQATWNDDTQREDITDQYKFKEGTAEERVAVKRANLHSSLHDVYENKDGDVTFELRTDEETFIGEAIKVCLTIKNTSYKERTFSGTIRVATIYYTGVVYKEVLKQKIKNTVLKSKEGLQWKEELILKVYRRYPNLSQKYNRRLKSLLQQEKGVVVEIPVEDYIDKLTDHCHLKVACMCVVYETKQTFTEIDDLRLRKPHLTIKAPEKGCTGKKFKVEVSFENPLPVTLTKCELRVEGPGLQRPGIYKLQNVNVKNTFTIMFELLPVKAGQKEIIVSFSSNQISSVNAARPIIISRF